MTLYQNKYRVETNRLKNWNYASDGMNFITICTKDRENILGKIEQGTMQLNNLGLIVNQCWFDLPQHYSNLILDAFVIMPNHLHGIMIIDNIHKTVVPAIGDGIVSVNDGGGGNDSGFVETGFKPVSTQSKPPPTTHGIFEFVRALKTFSSRRMNELENTPGKSRWQPRYYDHIIRDEKELHRIQHYIYNNPVKWEEDSLK